MLPVERGAAVNDDDVMRRHVINRVMCLLRLDLREVERGSARRPGPRSRPTARRRAELVADGLVTFDGDVLRVTPLGQLLVRNVAMLFDAYLKRHAARSSSPAPSEAAPLPHRGERPGEWTPRPPSS